MNKHEEFLKAYNDFPSQDNERYVPDRGGFKCGFSSAWDIQEKIIEKYKNALKKIVNDFNPEDNEVKIALDEIKNFADEILND